MNPLTSLPVIGDAFSTPGVFSPSGGSSGILFSCPIDSCGCGDPSAGAPPCQTGQSVGLLKPNTHPLCVPAVEPNPIDPDLSDPEI